MNLALCKFLLELAKNLKQIAIGCNYDESS
jgi:hypothetical protein